ncbi:MAG: hypothetical protein ABII95_03200 [Patescibacteria group bacterium]|nr:hypothetical protein [Patescibacteria group bacterium]MBU2068569.1 hypothetical protein [Patescibacteria group bacterium]
MKTISFILIIVGTLGLLTIEFTEAFDSFIFIFAGFNVLGLIMLAFSFKKAKRN